VESTRTGYPTGTGLPRRKWFRPLRLSAAIGVGGAVGVVLSLIGGAGGGDPAVSSAKPLASEPALAPARSVPASIGGQAGRPRALPKPAVRAHPNTQAEPPAAVLAEPPATPVVEATSTVELAPPRPLANASPTASKPVVRTRKRRSRRPPANARAPKPQTKSTEAASEEKPHAEPAAPPEVAAQSDTGKPRVRMGDDLSALRKKDYRVLEADNPFR
jgi:hypothetical protein